jgi:hypothetical protein
MLPCRRFRRWQVWYRSSIIGIAKRLPLLPSKHFTFSRISNYSSWILYEDPPEPRFLNSTQKQKTKNKKQKTKNKKQKTKKKKQKTKNKKQKAKNKKKKTKNKKQKMKTSSLINRSENN